MRMTALLCAREEQHEAAAKLLALAVERAPDNQKHVDDIMSVAKRSGGRNGVNKVRNEAVLNPLKALASMLESGECLVQPWPLTTVKLHDMALVYLNDAGNFARLLAAVYQRPGSAAARLQPTALSRASQRPSATRADAPPPPPPG